jgi:hypothetical protein
MTLKPLDLMLDHRHISLERVGATRKWVPRGGAGVVYPWPSLVKTARTHRFYYHMIENLKKQRGILGKFKKVLDIGQDRGDSMMWLSTISERVTGIDIDTKMIDLSLTNMRIWEQYNPLRHTAFVLPEKSLIDVDDPQWADVDLIKIDAGEMTLFVLEALSEVIERNRPMFFIVHNAAMKSQEIWDYLMKKHNYFAQVMEPKEVTDAYPGGVMLSYVALSHSQTNTYAPGLSEQGK